MPLEYHEDREKLPEQALEQHRAIASLIEELEAVAWYNQRAALSADESLRSILEHNRDEEVEHGCMLLEWLRRNFPGFDEQMRTYLFKEAPIVELEEMAEQAESGEPDAGDEAAPAGGGDDLGIGSLRKGRNA